MSFFIYKITNLVSGKIYVGKTTSTIRRRFSRHKYAAINKTPGDYGRFHQAMNHYGWQNFEVIEIDRCETEGELKQLERKYIRELHSNDPNIGYNASEGGEGWKYTEEAKREMSKNRKGKRTGKDNGFYGKVHTAETKRLISEKKKQEYIVNPATYNQLNIEQCSLNQAQCLEIQKMYLTSKYTMEKLAEVFQTNCKTIHRIIHGDYFAIKNMSIITETQIAAIKLTNNKRRHETLKMFTPLQEQEIINLYLKDKIKTTSLARKFGCSQLTIKNILIRNQVLLKK